MGLTKKWLYQNNFLGSHITSFTHLLLSGGKVHVPQEHQETLYKYYAKDVIKGNTNFITEMRTPVFKFHMDIDLLESQPIDPSKIINYCKTIQSCLKQFLTWKKGNYNKKKLMMIISISPEQTKVKNGIDYIKYGIHLNWPYLKVDTYIASILREGCVQYLVQEYGERCSDNPWTDVIDISVYTNNGLRWIYSDKSEKCPDCNGKGKAQNSKDPEKVIPCCRCEETGKIPANRIYEPISVLNGDNEILIKQLELLLKKSFHHVLKCVELLSIKCFDKTPNVEINEPFPPWYNVVDIVLKTKDNKSKKESNPIVQDHVLERGTIKKSLNILEQLTNTDDRYKMIENFIQTFMPEEYEDIKIIEVFFCGKKNSKLRYYIVRTNSKYCQNVNRDHTGNHIYFTITQDKFHQKCFNESECKDYIDKGKPIGNKMKQLLFPESLEALNEKREQIKYNPNKMLETKPLSNMMEQYQKYF